jgi:hypothetical protein
MESLSVLAKKERGWKISNQLNANHSIVVMIFLFFTMAR